MNKEKFLKLISQEMQPCEPNSMPVSIESSNPIVAIAVVRESGHVQVLEGEAANLVDIELNLLHDWYQEAIDSKQIKGALTKGTHQDKWKAYEPKEVPA